MYKKLTLRGRRDDGLRTASVLFRPLVFLRPFPFLLAPVDLSLRHGDDGTKEVVHLLERSTTWNVDGWAGRLHSLIITPIDTKTNVL